jgi:acetate kinase
VNVLVCNAGSSSLKFSLREAEGERLLLDGAIDWSSKAARLVPRRPGRPAVTRDLRVRRHGEAVARLIEKLRDRALNHESGLLGVSGLSPDMRVLLAAMQENADARLAINVYVHRLRQTIGAMAAVLGGVDALVFTAGVGENAPEVRRRACEDFGFLGIEMDEQANLGCKADCDIGNPTSTTRVLVITTREDLTIVRETRRVLAGANAGAMQTSNLSNSSPT